MVDPREVLVIMSEDILIELTRLTREALLRARRRAAEQQLGLAFIGLEEKCPNHGNK